VHIPVGKIALAGAGIFVAQDVLRHVLSGGDVGEGGSDKATLTGRFLSNRHSLIQGLKLGASNPGALITAQSVNVYAAADSGDRFVKSGFTDGIGDAYRHAYWQALTVVELVESAGMSVDQAVDAAASLGNAHERDSQLPDGKHREAAKTMDLFNNEIGRTLAREIIAERGEDASYTRVEVGDMVVDAMRAGKTVVMNDTFDLIPTTAASVAADIKS
jgi:hypothetical protein